MNWFARIPAVLFVGFSVVTNGFALPQLAVTAKVKTTTSLAVKVSILDTRLTKGTLSIERSSNGGTFTPVAQFTKLRRSSTYTDTALANGKHLYRARVVSGKTRTRWVKSLAVTLDSTGGVQPTPTPTPTPAPANFDGDGNVTTAGKILFGMPAGVSANRNAGATVWSGTCRQCHSTEKYNYTYPYVNYVVRRSPMNLSTTTVTDQNVADVVAYLNRFR